MRFCQRLFCSPSFQAGGAFGPMTRLLRTWNERSKAIGWKPQKPRFTTKKGENEKLKMVFWHEKLDNFPVLSTIFILKKFFSCNKLTHKFTKRLLLFQFLPNMAHHLCWIAIWLILRVVFFLFSISTYFCFSTFGFIVSKGLVSTAISMHEAREREKETDSESDSGDGDISSPSSNDRVSCLWLEPGS